MTKERKFNYELLGAHTDKAGKFFPRGSVMVLTPEEAKAPCFENKLKRIIDDSQDSDILAKATVQAEKQASKIITDAEKKAEEILAKAIAQAENIEKKPVETELVPRVTLPEANVKG